MPVAQETKSVVDEIISSRGQRQRTLRQQQTARRQQQTACRQQQTARREEMNQTRTGVRLQLDGHSQNRLAIARQFRADMAAMKPGLAEARVELQTTVNDFMGEIASWIAAMASENAERRADTAAILAEFHADMAGAHCQWARLSSGRFQPVSVRAPAREPEAAGAREGAGGATASAAKHNPGGRRRGGQGRRRPAKT